MSAKLVSYRPPEIRRLSEEEAANALDIKKGLFEYYIRVGPHGYFFTDLSENQISKYVNIELRHDDVFVIGFPKTGTHWTEELVWIVANDFNYEKATSIDPGERINFIGFSSIETDITKDVIKQACEHEKSLEEVIKKIPAIQGTGVEVLATTPSPRIVKTHLPLSMLPPNILDKSKVVYVARDPRDVAVSYFHMVKLLAALDYKGDFKEFWSSFKKNYVFYAPYLDHFKEVWALKDHPNILILFYEELSKDMPNAIRRVATFLGKTVTDEQVAGLCEYLKIENFRKNKMLNKEVAYRLGIFNKEENFIRKGKVGDWRNYFDEEMARDAERWMEEGLRGTDFKFQT